MRIFQFPLPIQVLEAIEKLQQWTLLILLIIYYAFLKGRETTVQLWLYLLYKWENTCKAYCHTCCHLFYTYLGVQLQIDSTFNGLLNWILQDFKTTKRLSQISLDSRAMYVKIKTPYLEFFLVKVLLMWGRSLTDYRLLSYSMFTVQLIKAGVCWSLFPDFKALAALQFYLTLTALKCCKSFWRGGKGIDSNSSNYGGVKVVAFWKAACTSSSSLACFLAILNATTPTVEVFLMQLLLHFTCQESWHEEEEEAAQSNRRKLANSHLNCI